MKKRKRKPKPKRHELPPTMIRMQEKAFAFMSFVRAICENSVNRADADKALAGVLLPDMVELAQDTSWYTHLPVKWRTWTRK